jgi:menaquinone-dependent protoporphyrinogen oxidase
MTNQILLTYATKFGCTAQVAEAMGETLRKTGAAVDIRPVEEVTSLEGYSAVVLGSGIMAGKMYPAAVSFLEKNQAALSQVPVAYFIACATLREDTPENRATVQGYIDALRVQVPQVQPIMTGLFGGALERKKLPLVFRLMIKAMKAPEGDFRDWAAIRAWAQELGRTLQGEGVIPTAA